MLRLYHTPHNHTQMSRKKDKLGNPIPYMRGGVIYEHIYEIELYEVSENAQFSTVFKLVRRLFPNVEYVYIKHDLDKFDDGTYKKVHYHLLLNFPREKSIKRLAEQLGVPINLIKWKAYLDLSVQYLIHLNNPEKAQYDIEALQGNNNWFMLYLGGDFASNYKSELSLIVNFIQKNKEHLTYFHIYQYCQEHNLLKVYKSWYQVIKDIYIET